MTEKLKISALDWILGILSGGMIVFAAYMAFIYAPTERTMGLIQRIFYFHVASAWLSFFAFFIVFVASLFFLAKRNRYWDIFASSSARIGFIFCTLVIITGPIWAKPVWGIWWTWDARLTSTFILWLMYMGYVMMRDYIYDPLKRGMLSAVIGIIGFLNVPFVYMSIRWWRTQHPQPVMGGDEGSGLDPDMRLTLFISLGAFTLLYIFLMRQIIRIERIQDEVDYFHKLVHQHE